ncbi:hypothetical protein UlMin_030621, partial [Ulmus minor]
VSNFRVEPPGLFRGHEEHPKSGKLKRRIRPSDVTINIGKDAPLPKCPILGERNIINMCSTLFSLYINIENLWNYFRLNFNFLEHVNVSLLFIHSKLNHYLKSYNDLFIVLGFLRTSKPFTIRLGNLIFNFHKLVFTAMNCLPKFHNHKNNITSSFQFRFSNIKLVKEIRIRLKRACIDVMNIMDIRKLRDSITVTGKGEEYLEASSDVYESIQKANSQVSRSRPSIPQRWCVFGSKFSWLNL